MRCSESAVGYATAQEVKKNQAKSQHRIASKYAYAAFGLHLLAG